jgi:hypothetical protein
MGDKDLVVQDNTGVAHYRTSTDAANLCKQIVLASALEIQGKKYVRVEGWQAIAIAHGCVASAGDVEHIEGGIRAIGRVIKMDTGLMISQAEGFVGEDETTWYGGTDEKGKVHAPRPEYARRAMAQTRAISRACRSAFAHVVVMMNAGLSTTPAEEVPAEGFQDHHGAKPPISKPQEKAAPPTGDSITTGVDSVTMKYGKKKDGTDWTLYTVHAGEKYSTFDKTMAENAKAAHEGGLMVTLTYEQTEKGRNLKTLEVMEAPEPGSDG